MTIKTFLSYLVVALGACLATSWVLKGNVKTPTTNLSATNVLTSTSDVQVTSKTSANQPDLKVTQKYTAIINDKKVEVPVKSVQTANNSVSPAQAGATGYTTSLKQEIDVTPLMKSLVPSWEVGIGVGTTSDNQVYVPLSIQRNYNTDKAIQVELHFGSNELKGLEVQHKWLF